MSFRIEIAGAGRRHIDGWRRDRCQLTHRPRSADHELRAAGPRAGGTVFERRRFTSGLHWGNRQLTRSADSSAMKLLAVLASTLALACSAAAHPALKGGVPGF